MFPTFVEYCLTNLALNMLKINIDIKLYLVYLLKICNTGARLALYSRFYILVFYILKIFWIYKNYSYLCSPTSRDRAVGSSSGS